MLEIEALSSNRRLRLYAGIVWPAFCALLGAWLFYKGPWPDAAYAVWGAGALFSVLGLLRPAAIRPLYAAHSAVGDFLSFLTTFLLLGLIYYVILTPIGWLLRLFGHDPLGRRPPSARNSYWVETQATAEVDRYFRQS